MLYLYDDPEDIRRFINDYSQTLFEVQVG